MKLTTILTLALTLTICTSALAQWRLEDHSPKMLKFGRNADSDTGDDVWDGSEAYTWPAAAATTTIVSASTDDDGAPVGTGALTVTVVGLDASYESLSEVATLNGQSAVTLSNDFLRVFRAYVTTAGTGGVNAGNIQVKHGSTVLAQITAGYGQTLMSIYTIPANHYGWLAAWRASSDGAAGAKLAVQIREFGGAWLTKDIVLLDTVGNSAQSIHYDSWQRWPPKTDIRVRVVAGGNGLDVASQFDLILNDDTKLPR